MNAPLLLIVLAAATTGSTASTTATVTTTVTTASTSKSTTSSWCSVSHVVLEGWRELQCNELVSQSWSSKCDRAIHLVPLQITL
jgi:hypothetical protein